MFLGQPMQPNASAAPPGKVQAAQNAIGMFASITQVYVDGFPREGRALSGREQAVYDAALDVLVAYFRGEQDYADGPQAIPQPPGDGPPGVPQPVGD